jgi:hypothetical protein
MEPWLAALGWVWFFVVLLTWIVHSWLLIRENDRLVARLAAETRRADFMEASLRAFQEGEAELFRKTVRWTPPRELLRR